MWNCSYFATKCREAEVDQYLNNEDSAIFSDRDKSVPEFMTNSVNAIYVAVSFILSRIRVWQPKQHYLSHHLTIIIVINHKNVCVTQGSELGPLRPDQT